MTKFPQFPHVTKEDIHLLKHVAKNKDEVYSLVMILNTYIEHKIKTDGATLLWFPTSDIVRHVETPENLYKVMNKLRRAAGDKNGTVDMLWCYLHGIHCLPEHEFEIVGSETYEQMFSFVKSAALSDSRGTNSNWLSEFPTTFFESIELHCESSDHQPLMNYYYARLKYILNMLSRFEKLPKVETARQKRYKIPIFGKSASAKPDNVFLIKDEVKDKDKDEDKAERTFATIELKTPSLVWALNKWKRSSETTINYKTEGFTVLHSILRQMCQQSLATNVSTPDLIDVLTYYPSKFEYDLLSQSCKTVRLNIGQVPLYHYDDDYDVDDELYKGNMFLALHANVFSSWKERKTHNAGQSDEWAKFLAPKNHSLRNSSVGHYLGSGSGSGSGHGGSGSGSHPGGSSGFAPDGSPSGNFAPGGSSSSGTGTGGSSGSGPFGSGGSAYSHAATVEEPKMSSACNSPCDSAGVSSSESGRSDRPSSSEISVTTSTDIALSLVKKKKNNNNNNNNNNYFCCNPMQESSEDHVNQVFSMTIKLA
ncbi:unnamed protein product [Ambrosiozyma monospora]|uniref:Unnamed protein product n=1 Tax=Ambrosiozyma monospora TaxID=43982 RepID=A0A9W6Z8F8_AMBMO|nr:unnamed protein product [Ambrosiozyma monospora]